MQPGESRRQSEVVMDPRERTAAGAGTGGSESAADRLRRRLDRPLRSIARRTVPIWFVRDRLDRVLSESIHSLEGCELIYAIDLEGRQVSSNVLPESMDRDAYGQDLSRRPYAVSLSVLHDAAFRGAFICDAYVSRVTERPCVTVMRGVTSGSSLLGFIAADFYPDD
jgi:hypothetical protein